MKLSKLIKIRSVFLQMKNEKMPIKTGYQIARFLQDSDTEFQFYEEKYREIILSCAELNEDGSPKASEDGASIKIQEDKMQECITNLNELENTDVRDFEIKINVVDLENAGLTVEQLYTIMDCLIE